jgi:hypothetical protein
MQTHKLEFNQAELSLDELIKVTSSAVAYIALTLDRERDACQYKIEYMGNLREHARTARHASQYLVAAAQDYAAAWNTLYALLESRDREITVRKEPHEVERE